MASIKFNGEEYPIPDGATAEQTLASLAEVMPEAKTAKLEKDGTSGNYKAVTSFGTKG